MRFPGRSRTSRFSGRRFIATAGRHFEHKSCAVKLHAYTLDSSCDLASALQQNMPFPQPPRNCSVFAAQHDKGFAPANRCSATSTANRPSLSTMPQPERTAAILVAAGRGLRAGAGGPKQYRSIGGQAVIFRAMEPFCRHPQVFAVQPVLNPDDTAMFNAAVSGLRHAPPASGGATRQASVHAGLRALVHEKPDIVLIHDAARPFVTAAVISRAIEAAGRTGAAVPSIPVTDTIKQVGDSGDVEATPDRARLRIAQTPQAFRFDVILEAHRRAARDGRSDFTDDAALAEWAGLTVAPFEGDPANMKRTTPEAFVREEARLASQLGDIRTGTGYDVHAFGDGDHLMICGVRVPHTRGFLAHSDGDVGLHALVDAILGALADGDIGSHFPPTDPQWKGAASDRS